MEMDDNGPETSRCETRWSQQLSGLPHKLQQRLMPFQRQGVEFMGLGKTVQAIAAAYTYRHEWPLLVVVPSSLKYPWIEELEKWIPELKPGDINLVENKSHTMGISSSKVTVLGYGLLTSDARTLVEALSRQRFAVVVVDESHYLKSRNAARTKILVPFIQNAKRALLLTGTPALGRPEELFMQIDALYPKRFGTWTEFAKKYCNAHYRYFGTRRQWDCRGASNLDELHKALSQIMIRRLKQDVLTQLPPKVRQRIPFDLPKEAAKEAASSFAEWERLMKGTGSKAVAADNLFTEVMGLVTQMYKQTAIAKAGAVKDYIKMMLEAEQLKFLVFAHHLTMLQACTEAAIEAKAGYIRIDGSVPSSERMQLVHKFQTDPETRVAILSIQAAGQGLTFTAASHVVFAELYWNPGHMKQAEDRAHRIGQTCSVNVHYLIAKGTFDTVLWGMLNRKETVTGSTLNGRKEYLNFEKNKQHDIRSFLSPNASKEKKRKRIGNESTPRSAEASPVVEVRPEEEESSATPEDDFAPQQKRLKTPQSTPSPVSRSRGKRRATFGGTSANSPLASFLTPRRLAGSESTVKTWSCQACTYCNSGLLSYCEMCEAPRPTALSVLPKDSLHMRRPALPSEHHYRPNNGVYCFIPDVRNDQDDDDASLPVYTGLQFCASQYTDRIYIYSKDGAALDCSFIPLDVKLSNWDELPPALQQRGENRIQVMRFVQEWSGLTAMKQKLLRRSGALYHSPSLGLQQLANNQRPHASTKRLEDEVALASLDKAQKEGGSVRVVTKDSFFQKRKSATSLKDSSKPAQGSPRPELGYVQAVDGSGVPLCLSCQQPCAESGGAWDTRFCTHRCQEEFQLRSSQSYMRSRVLEVEQGVCQLCGLHAHDLYLRVRDAPPAQRKQMLENTWLAQLPLNKLNEMIRGQCSLDNLQTLCTVCHRQRTARQAKERSQIRRSAAASKVATDITKTLASCLQLSPECLQTIKGSYSQRFYIDIE
uniref:Zinc finger, RAN-binding domain containing 3 n=1 Tax=Neogobius melanostomus TaxID=47308 RepID=A0A8C6S4L7_9GOBI